MSTSSAVPILHTPDLWVAYGTVQQLLNLVIPMEGFRVSADAMALTVAEAQLMAITFPEGIIAPDDPYRPESNAEVRRLVTSGDPGAEAVLPTRLYVEDQPVGSIEEAFFSAVGTGPGSIDWSRFGWPAVPELDLGIRSKDAHLQIAINARDVHCDARAADHTVFIHFRTGDIERAEWLAQKIGLHCVGPEEGGW